MTRTLPYLTPKPPLPCAGIRRCAVGSAMALGLFCVAGVAFAAEPSADATPSALNLSVIQGLSNMDEDKTAAPAPAAQPVAPESLPPAAAPEPAAELPAESTADQAPAAGAPAGGAPAEARSQVVVVEMPSGQVQRPAAGSAAADVEKRVSTFDMSTIRALASPDTDASATKPDTSPPPAPLQSAKAPGPITAPASQGAGTQPNPASGRAELAAPQPLPASQMELIEEVFRL